MMSCRSSCGLRGGRPQSLGRSRVVILSWCISVKCAVIDTTRLWDLIELNSLKLVLRPVIFPELATLLQELPVWPLLHNLSLFEHNHLVGVLNG